MKIVSFILWKKLNRFFGQPIIRTLFGFYTELIIHSFKKIPSDHLLHTGYNLGTKNTVVTQFLILRGRDRQLVSKCIIC